MITLQRIVNSDRMRILFSLTEDSQMSPDLRKKRRNSMNFSNTFTPYKIGNLMIKNRLTVPAMDSGVFSPEGYVAQSTLDYYGARAAGGFGLIIIEIAAVEKRGVGMPHEPNVWSDDVIEGLTKLANCIKNKGARTIVQLHHAGRETVSAMAGEPIAAPSSVPCPTNRETPHEFTTQEVYDLIRHYVEAAVRCRKAGFDGVEIHAAHGYMGGQFLSSRWACSTIRTRSRRRSSGETATRYLSDVSLSATRTSRTRCTQASLKISSPAWDARRGAWNSTIRRT